MAPHFRDLTFPPGAIIGLIGESGCGAGELLRLAAEASCRVLDDTLAQPDAFALALAAIELQQLRRAGGAAVVFSHDEAFLLRLCDEIWWLDQGKLAARGDPREVLGQYQRHVMRKLSSWAENTRQELSPSIRRGDGRAHIVGLEILSAEGTPTVVWGSGEPASVRVTVRFEQAVADPVVGIMIRTWMGVEVYGTNTELENLTLGACAAGDALRVTFTFRCDLCPQQYTLTAASHDPDGVWHDWMEDAVAFSVADSRYTAGVANLHASVSFERLPSPAMPPGVDQRS
jgi:hypothetical protein